MLEFLKVWWSLALIAGGVCWLLRDRVFGGWLLYFLFALTGSAGLACWRLYEAVRSPHLQALLVWDFVAMLGVVALTSTLVVTRDRKWVSAVCLAILFKATISMAMVFQTYPRVSPIALVVPGAWCLYLLRSQRVRRAFPPKPEIQQS